MNNLLLSIIVFAMSLSAADRQLLPDASRTPGVINPAVTQANIRKTVCSPGWTKTIRPPAFYTNKLKAVQMKELGLKGKPADYEEDHFLSLEIGGHPRDPQNLWPEPWPAARQKDTVETYLKRQVCSGKLTLIEAQTMIRTDWTKVYEQIKGEPPKTN